PRGDVFGVARFGDVVRHVRPLRRVAPLGDDDEDVRVVGRELQIGRRLALGELVLRQRGRLLFLVLALLLLRLDARVLDQRLFLGLDELLAVGLARIPLARGDVGELLDRAAVERHHEEVVLADEGDRRLVARPARIRFGAGRARDLPPRAGRGVDEHDVAGIGEDDAAVRAVPRAVDRRGIAAIGIAQLARLAAVARD